MKKYKITYNEGSKYNLLEEVKADNPHEAIFKFTMEHPHMNEIVKIEEVK